MAFSSMIKFLLFAASLTRLLAFPFPPKYSNHLLAGEEPHTGGSLTTNELRLTMQSDCNLVLYDNNDRPIWASGTNGKGSGCDLTLQKDGNLVVYDFLEKAVWESDTARGNGNYIVILQKDGNVAIYGNPIWSARANFGGSVGVVIAAAGNGTVEDLGAKQNKVRKMGKIMEVINGE